MNIKKQRTPCLQCGAEPYRSFYTYCSNTCQREFEYKKRIAAWKAGEITGLQRHGIVTTYVKRYLRDKFNDRCCLCGWSEINRTTGRVPLVADHIDGNWQNNREENLRLICPNCDSLTPTYSALNKGNGRPNRVLSKRTMAARLFIPKSRKAK